MKKILAIICLFNYIVLFACSMFFPPPEKFDPDEFIFIGKVVDHLSQSRFAGILVEIEDEIYLPEKVNRYIEIYPLSFNPDCSKKPRTLIDIKNSYPVGSFVRIIGKKLEFTIKKTDDSNIQLQATFNGINISPNMDIIPRLKSTKESEFNYQYTQTDSERTLLNRLVDSLNILDDNQQTNLSWSIWGQETFEFRKDLYRLYSSKNIDNKIEIINRIKYYSRLEPQQLINIIFEYIGDKDKRDEILHKLFTIRKDNIDKLNMAK